MKMHTRISRKQILTTMSNTFAILSILVGAAAFGFFGKGITATHAAGLQSYTPGGTWISLSNQEPLKPASVIGVAACPSNAVQYNAPYTMYNCHEIVYDGNAHPVWIREGRPSNPPTQGFGIAHTTDHNVMLQSVEDVIETTQQPFQEMIGLSGTTRYDYKAGYRDPHTQLVTETLMVVAERAPSTDPQPQASNNQNEVGLITAYCSGVDSTDQETYQQTCPDWVNATIAQYNMP